MTWNATAHQIEDVPRTASVSDFDELTEESQQAIQRLAAGECVNDVQVEPDVVRFGSYYRIENSSRHASD
jgi:hypothetical protein